MDNHESITHYAVLIGIDDYPKQPLKSAARDAREAQRLLEGDSRLKDCIKIYPLIAERRGENSSASNQDHGLKPTRENFIRILSTITNVAGRDSFVYVHFSGHGTKPSKKEQESGDVGIVLLDEDDDSGNFSYLWGEELATLVKGMVVKGITVTVVLDCCFSGAIYRRDSEVRYFPYDAKMDRWEKQIQKTPSEVPSRSSYRDLSSLPNWLRDPEGYAIITACGPHEEAASSEFDDKPNGILSYYLLDTLRYIGLSRSLKTVYDRLRVKIQSHKPGSSQQQSQKPMLYGNKDQAFFGSLELNSIGINIPIIKRGDGTIELQAGHAHGMSVGDEFAVFPARGETIPNQSSPIVRATQCDGLTSILEFRDSLTVSVRTGWLARVVSQSRLRNIATRLAPSILDQHLWLPAMEARSLRAHDLSDNSVSFELSLDDNQQYQLLEKNGSKVANIPAMSSHQNAPDEICGVLEHLSRFKLASNLANEPSAADYLDNVEISITFNRKSYCHTDDIAMSHGAVAELAVANKGTGPVYTYIYDLGPEWQVEQLFRGSYSTVNPGATGRKKFKMTVPKSIQDKGGKSFVDVLKVIVTLQPASFDLLELPRLGELVGRRSGEANRDAFRGPKNWIATNFPIRISMGQKR